MITDSQPIKINGYDAVELTSDAQDDISAAKEFYNWCVHHNCSRQGETNISRVQRNGHETRIGIAYPAQSVVDQGKEIYQRKIRPQLGPEATGKYLAIDCKSEDYAMGPNELQALDALEKRYPDARVYLMRVGYAALAGVGATVPRSEES